MPQKRKSGTQSDSRANRATPSDDREKVRYAVVGLGYISQAAVLPAFAHAKENSQLAALVSDDPRKLEELGRKYKVERLYSYGEYDECLKSGEIDAVYIALPNNMHCEYTVRAAKQGVHVLCEKPMAVTEQECEEMIAACENNDVRLMIAYRLHFEEANLEAIRIAESGQIGELRYFSSLFTMQVRNSENIRLQSELGGGTLYDIGIYCINAARYLLRAEPSEVFAWTASKPDDRFREVQEMTAAVMRFPDDRLAEFMCSFGAAPISSYRIVGTKGDLRVEPAYEFAADLKHYLTINETTKETVFKRRDQFAPELVYFSRCVLLGTQPEPSGEEGLADVRIVRAMYRSAEAGTPVLLGRFDKSDRPNPEMEMKKPPVRKPELVHAESPSKGN